MNATDPNSTERRLHMAASIVLPDHDNGKPVVKYSIYDEEGIVVAAGSKVGTFTDLQEIAASYRVARGDKRIDAESLTIAEVYFADQLGWLLDGQPKEGRASSDEPHAILAEDVSLYSAPVTSPATLARPVHGGRPDAARTGAAIQTLLLEPFSGMIRYAAFTAVNFLVERGEVLNFDAARELQSSLGAKETRIDEGFNTIQVRRAAHKWGWLTVRGMDLDPFFNPAQTAKKINFADCLPFGVSKTNDGRATIFEITPGLFARDLGHVLEIATRPGELEDDEQFPIRIRVTIEEASDLALFLLTRAGACGFERLIAVERLAHEIEKGGAQ